MTPTKSACTALMALCLPLFLALPAAAQDEPAPPVVDDGAEEPSADEDAPQPAPTEAPDAFEKHLNMEAAIEVEIGLRLFEEGDDYRAITALKRYRLLADSRDADRLANLIIGDIYRRNEFDDLARRHFLAAHRADPDDLGARHLGIQQLCVALKAYATCRPELDELRQDAADNHPELAELASYHGEFVDFVMGYQQRDGPDFRDPNLQRAALELRSRADVFDELPMKSPLGAGLLSALIPGLGQAYVGRWADAGLAFASTGILAGATSYSYFGLESLPLTIASGLLTLGFYSGNIANAVVDARTHNARLYDDFFDGLHRDLWPRLYLEVDDNEIDYDYRFDWPGLMEPESEDERSAPPGLL